MDFKCQGGVSLLRFCVLVLQNNDLTKGFYFIVFTTLIYSGFYYEYYFKREPIPCFEQKNK